MVSNFRIFTAILSGYIGLGLLYNLIISYIVRHFDLNTVIRMAIDPPSYIRTLNTIFHPINKVMNYIRVQCILEEESLEDLETIFSDDDEEDSL